MKVVAAVDSWKGCLSSMEAGKAVRRGVLMVCEDAVVNVVTLADGGEGTCQTLISAMKGSYEGVTVTGPLGGQIQSRYGIIDGKNTAIIEMAEAAGITLVPENMRNPMGTTTYGVGELIRAAFDRGLRNFIIGIGGSATNDGGIGMLQALGFDILDRDGNQVSFGARGLSQIYSIDNAKVIPGIRECTFRVACDVRNPLCGADGCSAVYGPQKGATAEMIKEMDVWLEHYAELTRRLYPEADRDMAGAGAAGGLGYALSAYLGAELEPGVGIVLEESGVKDIIKNADIVVTGEGRIDEQTMMGKAPAGIAALAKRYGKPVIAVCGSVNTYNAGIDAVFPVAREPVSLDQAMRPEYARQNIADTVEQVFRVIKCCSGVGNKAW